MRLLTGFGFVVLSGLFFVSTPASAQATDTEMPTPPSDLAAPDAAPVNTPNSASPLAAPPEPELAIASEATPRDETTELRPPNWPLLITAATVFAASYGTSVIVGAVSDRESNERLFLPAVGPWFALQDMNCDTTACKNETLYKGLLIADGAVQGLAVVGVVLGAVLPAAKKKPWYLVGDRDLVVAPQMGLSRLGVVAAGRF